MRVAPSLRLPDLREARNRGGLGARRRDQSIKKVAAASFIGTSIQWYDFFLYGTAAALVFGELFGTRVRYSGASLGYQLASVFAGGLAPLVATALLAAGDGSPTLVALYMMAMGLISVVATWYASETFQKDVHEDEQEERELVREKRFDREKFREPAGMR